MLLDYSVYFLLPAYDYDCDYDCDNNYGEYNTNCANNHIC